MDKNSAIYDMMTISTEIRGIVIEGCINIERTIDFYISHYFCSEQKRAKELMEHVFIQLVNAETKRIIFMNILQRNQNNDFKKYKKTLDKIIVMMEDRNILAHSELDVSLTAIEHFHLTGEVSFKKYRKGLKTHSFHKKQIGAFLKDQQEVSFAIDDIMRNSIRGRLNEVFNPTKP